MALSAAPYCAQGRKLQRLQTQGPGPRAQLTLLSLPVWLRPSQDSWAVGPGSQSGNLRPLPSRSAWGNCPFSSVLYPQVTFLVPLLKDPIPFLHEIWYTFGTIRTVLGRQVTSVSALLRSLALGIAELSYLFEIWGKRDEVLEERHINYPHAVSSFYASISSPEPGPPTVFRLSVNGHFIL